MYKWLANGIASTASHNELVLCIPAQVNAEIYPARLSEATAGPAPQSCYQSHHGISFLRRNALVATCSLETMSAQLLAIRWLYEAP